MLRLPIVMEAGALVMLASCAATDAPHPKTLAPVAATPASVNAMLAEWTGPYGGVPPFDKLEHASFEPAFDLASKQWLAEIDAIANNPEPPTFENTLAAVERSGWTLRRLQSLFSTLASSVNTPPVQALSAKIRPRHAAVVDQVNFNEKLFARVETVYRARHQSELDAEQIRLVERVRNDFLKHGAGLEPAPKRRLGQINERLASLFTDFGNRVQADEDSWVLLADGDLAGLPAPLVAAYRAAAAKRQLDGYAVVNTRSAVDPFLTFSQSRELREKVWRAFVSRGDNGDAHDTKAIIAEIVSLRAERAKLLGFASHAHWRMTETMAKDPARAQELMMRVWPAAKKRAQEEIQDMQARADAEGAGITIAPWDHRFYMEKVRKDRYDLDQNELKSYFELENMIEASYYLAGRLYGYAFEEITGPVPTFHPDVRVYHVTNLHDGSHVGLFYRDDYARQYKRSGAWQATYRAQHKLEGQVDAIVSNNNNFTPAAAGEPVLISFDDAETLFHEFGHALHALTNDTTYPKLGNTPRDFVEFPSQVHENWVLTRDLLDRYARHYKTGEPIPESLVDKAKAASSFNQGFVTVEYLAAALIDMKLHTDPGGMVDAEAFERETLAELGMPEEIALRHRLPHFLHLFATDAYSAGYYSYLWSDVMAADAWEVFVEAGDPWHPPTAAAFKSIILATGDAIDRAQAFREFRGRDPEVGALMRSRGFAVD